MGVVSAGRQAVVNRMGRRGWISRMRLRTAKGEIILALGLALPTSVATTDYNETVEDSFTGYPTDGANPEAGLVRDAKVISRAPHTLVAHQTMESYSHWIPQLARSAGGMYETVLAK